MQTFNSEFDIGRIVELEANAGEIENRFGKITKIAFRQPTRDGFVVDYSVQLFNSNAIVEVLENEILNSFWKEE